ncbi:MAG: DUF86 domain-containing protein [Holophagales bacterium]|nr:DUF86 domain-containing protein [Holophagales bacterium]
MVDRSVLESRLGKLEELLAKLRSLAELDRAAFLADDISKTLAERWLQLALECATDLGHHVIASEGWPSPSSYRETFRILAERGVLSAPLASQMERWAGLRNVLVHLYLEIDHRIVFEALTHELDHLEAFAAAIARAASSDEDRRGTDE